MTHAMFPSILLLLNNAVVGMPQDICAQKPLDQDNALDCCRRTMDGTLPISFNRSYFSEYERQMRLARFSEVWMSPKRKNLSVWSWINGQEEKKFGNYGDREDRCAYYNRSEPALYESRCSDLTFGYMCHIQDCLSCASLGWKSNICMKIGNTCFLYFCEKNSWYNARYACQEDGDDLAVFKNKSPVTSLTKLKSKCENFWIGLRSEDWSTKVSNISVEPIWIWGKGEPSDVGDCLVFYSDKEESYLKASDCSAKKHFICQASGLQNVPDFKEPESSYTNLPVTSTQGLEWPVTNSSGYSVENGNRYRTKLIMGATLGSLALTLSVVFIYVIKKKIIPAFYKRHPTRINDDTDIPLMSKQTERLKWNQGKRSLVDNITKMFGKIESWSWLDDDASLAMDDIFTDLELVELTQTTRGLRQGSISDYCVMFEKVQLFIVDKTIPAYGIKRRLRIKVIGEAGTGKTTLCQRLAIDWSKNAQKLSTDIDSKMLLQFELIIPIFLRYVAPGQGLEDIFQSQLLLNVEESKQLYEFLKRSPSKVLLVLDGYDEYKEENSEEVTSILRGELPDINLFLTTRPLHTSTMYPLDTAAEKLYTVYLLKGFTDTSRDNFINSFFNHTEEGGKLKEKINSAEDLKSYGRCPTLLLLMCILWREYGILAETLADLYKEIIKHICGRCEQKYYPKQVCSSKGNILQKYKTCLHKIGRLASKGLQTETFTLWFPKEEVLQEIGEGGWKLGIFKAVLDSSTTFQRVEFYHKSLQEYFAALYLVDCCETERETILVNMYSKSGALTDLSLFTRFLSALGGETFTSSIIDIINKSPDKTAEPATKVQLDYLSQNKKAQFSLPQCIHLPFNHDYTSCVMEKYFSLDGSNVRSVILEMANVRELELLLGLKAPGLHSLELRFQSAASNYDTTEKQNRLALVIPQFPLEILAFKYFPDDHTTNLLTALKFLKEKNSLRVLDFSSTFLSDKLISLVSTSLLHLRNLETFCICNDMSTSGPLNVEGICKSLQNCRNLKRLDFSGRRITDICYKYIGTSMKFTPKLTHLFLSDAGEGTCDLVESITLNLQYTPNIVSLKLGSQTVGFNSLTNLTKQIGNLKKLETVEIIKSSCNDEKTWTALVLSLHTCTNLFKINFSGNKFGDPVTSTLIKQFANLHNLHYVNLSDCKIELIHTLQSFFLAVQKSQTIKHLILSGNNFASLGDSITEYWKQTQSLETLDLSECGLDPDIEAMLCKEENIQSIFDH